MLRWAPTALVGILLASWAFARGLEDWRYQLAGLADPFLGRPAPGWTIGIGLVVTLAAAGVAWAIGAMGRRNRGEPSGLSPDPDRPRLRPRWWLPLAAGWAAYALGAIVVIAGGGSRTYEATISYGFSVPIDRVVEVAGTCHTPVGQPELLAELTPTFAALPRFEFMSLVTGRRDRWPHDTEVITELHSRGGGAVPVYRLPNVPARPLPYLLATRDDGTTAPAAPITFLEAYEYRVRSVGDEGLTGRLELTGTRFRDPFGGDAGPGSLRWIDLEIPRDPWPPTIEIDVSWSCRT